MPDYQPCRHPYRHPRWRRDTLDNWENEGGSLCRPVADDLAGGDPSAGPPATDFALLDTLPLGILITNRDGEIIYCNPAIQKLYAASAAELLGTPWRRGTEARDVAAIPAASINGSGNGQLRVFEVRVITGSGQRIWTRHSVAGLGGHEADGGHIHIIEDITRIKAAEQARMASLEDLATERERARVTLECIGDAVISTDAKGRVTYLNSVAEQLTGWSRQDAGSQPLSRVFRVVDSDSGRPIHNPAERAMESLEIVQMPANSLLLRPDGSELAIEDSAAPILDKAGRLTGAVVIFRDRRLSRESTAMMAYLARHDSLTGLPNRFAFAEHFDQAMNLARRRQKWIGLLFIDLDHFKQVNDSLGHEAGDRLLQEVSRKLAGCVRSTDLVCRHGGDEFVALLSELKQPGDAAKVALKMQAAAARACHIQGYPLALELSIGISLYPDDGADMATLMSRADAAMYHAKFDSEAGYCFHHSGMERPDAASRFGKTVNEGKSSDSERPSRAMTQTSNQYPVGGVAMNKNQIKGSTKEITGKTREVVGKVTGSKKLQRQGKTKRYAGKAQKAVGKAQARVKRRAS